jgi:hypothetical protein
MQGNYLAQRRVGHDFPVGRGAWSLEAAWKQLGSSLELGELLSSAYSLSRELGLTNLPISYLGTLSWRKSPPATTSNAPKHVEMPTSKRDIPDYFDDLYTIEPDTFGIIRGLYTIHVSSIGHGKCVQDME